MTAAQQRLLPYSKVKNVAAVLLHQVFQLLRLLLKWIFNCGTVAPDTTSWLTVSHSTPLGALLPHLVDDHLHEDADIEDNDDAKEEAVNCSVPKGLLTHGYDTSEHAYNKCRCSSHCQQHMSFRYKCCCREQRWKRCSPTWRRCSCATTTSAASRISWALSSILTRSSPW